MIIENWTEKNEIVVIFNLILLELVEIPNGKIIKLYIKLINKEFNLKNLLDKITFHYQKINKFSNNYLHRCFNKKYP